MPSGPTNSVIEHLRTAVLLRDGAGLGDGELLGHFVERHEEAALAALVQRHATMVWGVCRRLLSHHDAEDAFQATFLVLVRKAASVVPRTMVGNWLYGVAHQTALQARRTAARRRAKEVQVTEMPDTEAVQPDQWLDVQPLLDQELSHLPDNYRAVLVLCDLEGRTRKETAGLLGVPEGTVAGRLARARAMLAKRLARQGVALSGGALAAVLAQNVASAGVPASVVASTIRAASLFAAGQVTATGPVSVKAVALTEGVLKAMLMSKLKAVVALVLVLGFMLSGAAVLSYRTATAQDRPPTAEERVKAPQKQEKDKEDFTAWGKEVGGLQAGLGYYPGQKRAYSHGETVRLVVRVRNVGTKEVKFQYFNEFFYENPPAVTDGEGKPVPLEGAGLSGLAVLREVNLAPGKEVKVCEMHLGLRPAGERDKERPVWKLFGTGKFQLQYENVGGGNIGTGEIKFDPVLSKLATGKLELEVKEAEKPEKEGFTAWGKEVGGLQAGLGYRPGEHRVYHHGETVTMVLRVRNVGKETVEFKHIWAYFVENPPTITDADGNMVQLPRVSAEGLHGPRSPTVAPCKEVELFEWQFDLQPQGGNNKKLFTIHGTGKFSLQCERIVGPTSCNPNHPNPTLSKLATGKLELEIKSAPPVEPGKE
jgi:RNA polymerase sigma factor (sigma-70 family)